VASGASVVVVDNASSDSTPDLARRADVHLITNRRNRGFAAAVNQGFSILQSTYVLLLNPDALLQTDLSSLREACDLPHAAGAGGCLLDESGRPQIGFMVRSFPTPAVLALEALLLNRTWPNNPINASYRGMRLDYSVVQSVEQPAGAFLMIRRAVWEELGGFDESFWPLWFEDVDFCRRAADRGYLWYYTPAAVCQHTGGHSIVKLALEMRLVYWYGSVLRYSAKHFRPRGVRAVCVAVISGSLLRMLPEAALRRSLKPVVAYSKVIWLAGRYFLGWRDIAVASVSSV